MVEALLHSFCCFECNSLFAIGSVRGWSFVLQTCRPNKGWEWICARCPASGCPIVAVRGVCPLPRNCLSDAKSSRPAVLGAVTKAEMPEGCHALWATNRTCENRTCENWPFSWRLSWALPWTPSWDVSWGLSWGVLEGLKQGSERSWALSWAPSWALVGTLVDPLVGSNFAVRVLCACLTLAVTIRREIARNKQESQEFPQVLRALRPLTAFKRPRTPNLSRSCPDDCFSGFQSGGPKFVKNL